MSAKQILNQIDTNALTSTPIEGKNVVDGIKKIHSQLNECDSEQNSKNLMHSIIKGVEAEMKQTFDSGILKDKSKEECVEIFTKIAQTVAQKVISEQHNVSPDKLIETMQQYSKALCGEELANAIGKYLKN